MFNFPKSASLINKSSKLGLHIYFKNKDPRYLTAKIRVNMILHPTFQTYRPHIMNTDSGDISSERTTPEYELVDLVNVDATATADVQHLPIEKVDQKSVFERPML